jgi:hypothetical protein
VTEANRALVLSLYDDMFQYLGEGFRLGQRNDIDEAYSVARTIDFREQAYRAGSDQGLGDPVKNWAPDDAVDRCESKKPSP